MKPGLFFGLKILLTAFATSMAMPSYAALSPEARSKIHPLLLRAVNRQDAQMEALLQLKTLADAALLNPQQDYLARRRAWVSMLRSTASDDQAELLAWLEARHIEYRAFWINNTVWVRADAATVAILAERSDIVALDPNTPYKNRLPIAQPITAAMVSPDAIDATEWGVRRIHAPSVWAAGITGQGVVIAGEDTGYRWDHNALRAKYRGWNGTIADHNYNWHDAIHVANASCVADTQAPCDDDRHGTHTMGTMLGDDGASNKIGVAPGARWIGCRNMNAGDGTPARYVECMQWMMAPTDLTNQNPQPDLAPDVISNSWGCPASEGCVTGQELVNAVNNVAAAGIFFVAAAGNDGSASSTGCATIFDAPAIYDSAFIVAATTNTKPDGVSSFSSRGPVRGAARVLPDAGAPGSNIRSASSATVSTYATMSGTSMATPHVAGAAALLMATNPALKGHPDQIANLLRSTAVHINGGTQSCGGIAATTFPNPVQGSGRIDVYAAFLVAEKIFKDGFGSVANN